MIFSHQTNICKMIESVDGAAKFKGDSWAREGGGGGLSMVLSNGSIFEKAGINLAVVYGVMPPEALQAATKNAFDRSGLIVSFFI